MYQRNRLLRFCGDPVPGPRALRPDRRQRGSGGHGRGRRGPAGQDVAHWSRWDYRTETTPGEGQAVHIVEKGDTLWDLGAKYLGNPFAWPQIWELNKWVKDPHWIYPGDPIVVEASRGTVTQPGDGSQNLAPQGWRTWRPTCRRVPKPTLDEYALHLPGLHPDALPRAPGRGGLFQADRRAQDRGPGGQDQGHAGGRRLPSTSPAVRTRA